MQPHSGHMSTDQVERVESGDERPSLPPTSLKLARLRLAAELGRDVNQEEMAERVGISRTKYSSLEAGSYEPSKALARKISEVTGQSVGEVIDEYERRRPV